MVELKEYQRSTNPWYMPKKVFPVPSRVSLEKPIVGFACNDNTFIESDGNIYNGLDIFERCIGKTYVSENEYRFSRFLSNVIGEEKTKELVLNKSIKIGKIIICSQSAGFNYMDIRSGNKHGKIMAFTGFGRDAVSCEMIAQQIFSSLNEIMHLPNLEPAIKVGERLLREFCLPALFKTTDMESTHLIKAVDAFDGGRTEVFHLGNYDKIYSTDINAAYLSELRNLPNLSPKFVEWVDCKEYRSDAIVGFINCRIDMPSSKVGLLTFRFVTSDGRERMFYPTGTSTIQTITKTEYDLLIKNNVKVEIESASWAIPIYSVDYPFQVLFNKIQEMAKYPILKQYRKNIYSKIWGKMASTTSLIYNPFYASELTSRVRCRVADIAVRNIDSILGIKVDSIQSTSPLNEKISTEFGDMKEEHIGNAILCSDLYTYYPEEEKENNWFMGREHICLKSRVLGINDAMGEIYGMEDIGKKLEWDDDAYAPIQSQYGSSKRLVNIKLTKDDLENSQFETKNPSTVEEMKDIAKNWRGDVSDLF